MQLGGDDAPHRPLGDLALGLFEDDAPQMALRPGGGGGGRGTKARTMLHIALWPTCPGLFEDDAPHRFCWGIWRGTPERTKNDLGTRLQTPKTISGTRLGGPKAHCPGTPSSTKDDG